MAAVHINSSPLLSSSTASTAAPRRSCCPATSLTTACAPDESEPRLLTYDPARLVWPDHLLCVHQIADLSVFGDVWVYIAI